MNIAREIRIDRSFFQDECMNSWFACLRLCSVHRLRRVISGVISGAVDKFNTTFIGWHILRRSSAQGLSPQCSPLENQRRAFRAWFTGFTSIFELWRGADLGHIGTAPPILGTKLAGNPVLSPCLYVSSAVRAWMSKTSKLSNRLATRGMSERLGKLTPNCNTRSTE